MESECRLSNEMTPLAEELRIRRFFFQRSFSVRKRLERADDVEVEKGVEWGVRKEEQMFIFELYFYLF